MAFTLDDLRSELKSVRIYVGSKSINLKIDPNALNNELMERYRDASDDSDWDTMGAVFAEVVKEWDILTEDDGPAIPIDGQALKTLPLVLVNKIWDEIGNLINPKSRKKNAGS